MILVIALHIRSLWLVDLHISAFELKVFFKGRLIPGYASWLWGFDGMVLLLDLHFIYANSTGSFKNGMRVGLHVSNVLL
jgi:hypothetical protein